RTIWRGVRRRGRGDPQRGTAGIGRDPAGRQGGRRHAIEVFSERGGRIRRAQREGVNNIAEISSPVLEVNGCGEGAAATASSGEAERLANRSSRRHRAIVLRPARPCHSAGIEQRPGKATGCRSVAFVLYTETHRYGFVWINHRVGRR